MDTIRDFIIAHPILATSLSSVWGAILLDLMAFRDSKEPGNFWGQFSFRTALVRYAQAFVAGFVGNAAVVAAGAVAATAFIFLWAW